MSYNIYISDLPVLVKEGFAKEIQSGTIKMNSTYEVGVSTISSMLSFTRVHDCYVRDTQCE